MKIKTWHIISIVLLIWGFYRSNTIYFNNKKLNEGFVSNNVEGFITKKKYLRQTPLEIYDKFYVKLYDKLFGSSMRVEYEFISTESKYIKTWAPDTIYILDVGCGTGHILRIAKRNKLSVDGMDNSNAMLQLAATAAPGTRLINGDMNDISNYAEGKYSHIYCMFFTIYYSPNISNLFKNFNWALKQEGMIFLHVVDRDKFDPVLESATRLIPFYDPQRYAKIRKTDTSISFNNLKYKSTWDFTNKNDVQFRENFILNDGRILQNIHHFNMPSEKMILKMANNNGFRLVKIIDMSVSNHRHNYIYCFKKKFGKEPKEEAID